MQKFHEIDLKIIDWFGVAYNRLWDGTGLTVGMLMFLITVSYMFLLNAHNGWFYFGILLICFDTGRKHMCQTKSLPKYNKLALSCREQRWVDYLIIAVPQIFVGGSLRSMFVIWLYFTLPCILVRERKPPEKKHKLATQGST